MKYIIYLVIFLSGTVLGYGLNMDVVKNYVPHKASLKWLNDL